MNLRNLAAVTLLSAFVTPACGGTKSPTAPSAELAGLAVTFPAGGTIYIGGTAHLQATETIGGATTRTAAGVIWSSDAPTVATVSQTGLVAALGAGEATITADNRAGRGTLRIRVYPNFSGTWTGAESTISCDDSGIFEGICSDSEIYKQGQLFTHRSGYTQSDAAVNVTLNPGREVTASGPGTVDVDGLLQLPGTRVLPEQDVKLDIQELRFRSDVPGRLTGTYLGRFTVAGRDGSVILGIRLEGVTRTAAVAAASQSRPNGNNGAAGSRWNSRQRKLAQRAGVHP